MKRQKKNRTILLTPFLILALVTLGISLFYDVLANTDIRDVEELQEDPIELELVYAYQNPQWNSAIEKVVQEFEEDHPEIDIHYDINYEDTVYEDLLSRRIARDELGDIVQLKTPEAYAANGLLGEISDDVASQVSSVYTYDGKQYGVGVVESTWGILYNKSMFDLYGLSEPDTYQEFLDLCNYFSMRNKTAIGVGGGDLWHMEFWVNHFFRTDVLAEEEDWLKKCQAGEVSWTDEEPGRMMDHLCELFDSGYVNEDWMSATDTSLSYRMSEGEFAMLYTGPWTADMISQLQPEMELGWFYVPDEDGVVYASDNLDTFWSVTANCAADPEKYEAAMTFLEYFYSRDMYRVLCTDSATFSLTDAEIDYNENSLLADAWSDFRAADHRVSIYIGNEDTPEDFERSMLEVVQETLNGTRTAEEGLMQIQQLWEQCME